MAIFTQDEIRRHKEALKNALLGVAYSQDYTIAGRSLRRMTASEIRAALEWLEQEEQKLLGTGGRMRGTPAIPGRRI